MLELLRKRRSIRAYTDEPVAQETVASLVEVALRSPSSRGTNPWAFVVVEDRELLSELSTTKQSGSSFLKGAPLAIVICADSTNTDVWVEDCSIAAILLQMAAESFNLGSCWIQVRNRQHSNEVSSEQFVQKLLGLPEHVKVECIISIGHPAEKREPVPADQLQYEKISYNRYGSK